MTEHTDSNAETEISQELTWNSNDPCITREEYLKGGPEERKRMVSVVYEWYLTENPRNIREKSFWDNWENRVCFDYDTGYLRLSWLVPPMPPDMLDLWYRGMEECTAYEEGDEY